MGWYTRCLNVFRPAHLSHALDDELTHHLAEAVDRLQSQGLSQQEALRIARLRLGNLALQKENTREMNILFWLDQTRSDLLYGLRQFKLSPGFAAVAILSLALGIGANTAIFQLLNAIRLKSLPVKDPQQLLTLRYAPHSHRSGWGSSRSAEFTYAQWRQLQQRHDPFSGVLAFSAAQFNLTTGGEPRFAEALYVSGNFFHVLGVPAIRGRTFDAGDDDLKSCSPGAVISYAFWQREFGSDPQVLGRKITLDGYPVPIIGITPPSFFGVEVGSRYDVAVPLCADKLISETSRIPPLNAWWLSIIARLKPGYTLAQANAYMAAISPQIMRATLPTEYTASFAKLFLANKLIAEDGQGGVSDLRHQYDAALYVLLSISGLVLLIACANLANLLLARATARESEIAVRLALGAHRSRVVRQFLVESLLLATCGTAVGAVMAVSLSRFLLTLITNSQSALYVDTAFDWRVLGFAAALALLTCLLFGLLPALQGTRLAPASAMRTSGRTASADRTRSGLRRALVVAQVALSLVLLVGAFLFIRSFRKLLTVDPGFRAEGILAVGVDFGKTVASPERRLATFRQLRDKFAAIPGVVSSAQTNTTPVSGDSWDEDIGPDSAPAANSHKQAWFDRVSPGYFATMQTRLIAGRDFSDHDTLSSTRVAIVSQEFARAFFPGVNPLGHTFHIEADAGKPEPSFQIVGIVQNSKYSDLREKFQPLVFFPVEQDETPHNGCSFVLRIAGSPSSVMRAAKSAVAGINPSFGIQFQPLSVQLADSILRERLMATLSAGLGFLAALLATLGLYGVIAYMVARRRKEIGIRVALGSDRSGVIRLVLGEAAVLLAIGLAVGVVIALWAGQFAEALLYGIQARDGLSLVSACVLLAAIGLLASYVPAHRAAAGNPMSALRIE